MKYTTLTYYLPIIRSLPLPPDCQVIKIECNNIGLITDYLYNLTHNTYENDESLFDLCVLQDTAYYLSQIKAGLLYIYCLRCKEHVYGIYYFKNTYTEYEDIEGKVLMFSTSLKNITNDELFCSGFINSMHQILKEKNN